MIVDPWSKGTRCGMRIPRSGLNSHRFKSRRGATWNHIKVQYLTKLYTQMDINGYYRYFDDIAKRWRNLVFISYPFFLKKNEVFIFLKFGFFLFLTEEAFQCFQILVSKYTLAKSHLLFIPVKISKRICILSFKSL